MRTTTKEQVGMKPIDWRGMSRRYMNPDELEVLIALVASVQPKGVLEFGVNVGRTARAILDNVPGIERYEGVDVPMGYVTSKEVQRKEVPAIPGEMVRSDPRFHLLLRDRGSLDLRWEDLAACDTVFIDGDLGRGAVENETVLARTLVRPGGIIVWHDYHDLGTVDVREVLNELAEAGAPLVHVEGTWLVYQRVPGTPS